jgi:hypothetical protein
LETLLSKSTSTTELSALTMTFGGLTSPWQIRRL